jgi:hypothetical protein
VYSKHPQPDVNCEKGEQKEKLSPHDPWEVWHQREAQTPPGAILVVFKHCCASLGGGRLSTYQHAGILPLPFGAIKR